MARLDLYRLADQQLVIDVQTDLLPTLGTRVVVPLMPKAAVPSPVSRLHPTIEIDGTTYVAATHLLSAVPVRELGHRIAARPDLHDSMAAALDMVFLGF